MGESEGESEVEFALLLSYLIKTLLNLKQRTLGKYISNSTIW